MNRWYEKLGQPLIGGAAFLAGLYLVMKMYVAGQSTVAVVCLAILCLAAYVYSSQKGYAYRYLFPGLFATLVFVLFPLIYTFAIGFTNYSSKNLLSFERATKYFLDETYTVEGESYAFTLHPDGNAFRVRLQNDKGEVFVTPALALQAGAVVSEALPPEKSDAKLEAPVEYKVLMKNFAALKKVTVKLPNGAQVSATGMSAYEPVRALYKQNADGTLTNEQDKSVLKPDMSKGFYVNASGESIQPGFKVSIGFDNFKRIFSDESFREPFIRIFFWTVTFAGFSVVCAFSLGITLAVLMGWEALRFRSAYQLLLFLPYAVPGFISILVFRGLFNENSGEINLVLNAILGIKPHWFTNETMAKVMLVVVNTWLGFPYMMLVSMGLIKAIPSDLYEASAIAGAGPLTNFFRITLPLIAKPMMPLLISAFAFNFNNFVIIALLTNGRPDFLDTKVPAGTTDILVSYTYRIAFQDSGQQFGLAAAISTVIFLMVAALSIVNMRLTKMNAAEGR